MTGENQEDRTEELKDFFNMLQEVPSRLVELLLKLMSRKGIILVTVTCLLIKGIVNEDVWFMTVTVIILNTEGVKVAELYRNR